MIARLLLTAAMLLAALPATGQIPNTLLHSIPAPLGSGQMDALLGHSVAVEGGYAVAGAPYYDLAAGDAGVVKVFDAVSGAVLHTIPNPTPQAGLQEFFGWSVALSGTRVIAGAHNDSTGASQTGSAYVFDLASPTPTVPVLTLNNPEPGSSDNFGRAVALSGTLAAVGAPYDDEGAIQGAGRVYVYDLAGVNPGVPVAVLSNPSPATNDQFGWSVAVSGTRIVVGGTQDDTGASDAGCVHVYDMSSGTPTVPVTTLNNPSPAAADLFGYSVGISGTRIVVGVMLDDTGATDSGLAYVFNLASGTPTVPVVTLNNPTPLLDDRCGRSVAISGARVIVGAAENNTTANNTGSAYVYDVSSATPAVPVAIFDNPYPTVIDHFGWSVAITGTQVIVGAYLDDTGAEDAGSAYVYNLGSEMPIGLVAVLNDPGPSTGDEFGCALALSANLMVVGARRADGGGVEDAGSAHVYDVGGVTPTVPILSLDSPAPGYRDYFGWAVAVSGNRVVVGAWADSSSASRAGIVYVYDLTSATPSVPVFTLNNPAPTAEDYFGMAVVISGNRVVVGAPGNNSGADFSGSAYAYDLGTGTPTVPVATLHNPSPAVNDSFGGAVAISGTRVVVGARYDDTGTTDAGSAYVYDLAGGTPTVPMATLNNPSPGLSDLFGNAVAISGTRIVIGAFQDNPGGNDAGSAYVYDLTSGTPTVPVRTLNNPAPAASDNFGYAVSISGTRIVVGAHMDDTGASNAGSAYVYDLTSGTPTVPVATLNNPTPVQSDTFGSAVAIDGTTIAIGAPLENTTAYQKGSAYIYGPDSIPPTGGTMTMNPFSPVDANAALTVAFASWTDASLPLSYEVYIDDIIIGVQDTSASRNVTGPASSGSHTLKGRIYDALGNFAEVMQSFTVRTPEEAFDAAMLAAGLTGPDALATATPKNDGVANLLKYAFNMNLSSVDVRVITPDSGTAGLPSITSPNSGVFRIEFLRRIGSGLVYAPQKSSNLADPGSWTALTDLPTIIPIDANWKRVIYEEPYDPGLTQRCFGRVQVTLPP